MNNYDLQHVTTAHAQMSDSEWLDAFDAAWTRYYSRDHIKTLLRRARASGIRTRKMANMALWFHGCSAIERVHPLDGGYVRMKTRSERRPGLPKESALRFNLRYGLESVSKQLRFLRLLVWLRWQCWRLDRDPETRNYRDAATSGQSGHAKPSLDAVFDSPVRIPTASTATPS